MPADHNSVFQAADDVEWNASHAQPYSGAHLSAASMRPSMAKCKHAHPQLNAAGMRPSMAKCKYAQPQLNAARY